jgi:hypothetical protein
MFNLLRDVIVTATQGMITIRDQGPPINVKAYQLTQTPVPGGMTIADFNGDGYDDFVLAQTDIGNDGKWHGYLEFVTAEDVNDLSQGLNPGPYVPADFAVRANALGRASITSGDLDGDGIPEVIVAYGSGQYGVGPRVEIDIYRFSPKDETGTLEKVGTATFNPGHASQQNILPVIVLAGNFTGATPSQTDNGTRDQLAVVSERDFASFTETYLTSIAVDVDPSQTPTALTPVVKKNSIYRCQSYSKCESGKVI